MLRKAAAGTVKIVFVIYPKNVPEAAFCVLSSAESGCLRHWV